MTKYGAIAAWMLIAGFRGLMDRPGARLGALVGGPVGFLTAEQRSAIAKWPGIKRVEHHASNSYGAIIVARGDYDGGTWGSIDIEANYYEKTHRLVVREHGIFGTAHSLLNERASANHWRWNEDAIRDTLAGYGCRYERGNVMTEIEGPLPEAEVIAEAAVRVADACRALAGLAG